MGTLLSAALMALASSGTAPAQTIAPGALQADLRFALDTIERQHPDLAHSVTKAALERGADRVRAQLDHPMDQAEAWAKLAQLNPVLADGHLFIGLPDWRGQGAQAVRQGTGFFPFEVAIDARDHPVIVSMLGGGSTPLAGRRILRIGGHDARHVAGSLLARTHGDTPAFRRALLAQRWWLFHAKLYGTPADYDLVLSGSRKRLTVPAEHTLPAILQRDASFDRLFACRIDTDKSARLTVASFVWEDKARFFQFTHDCFARIKAASVDRLVIDVSANGGGDDDMWTRLVREQGAVTVGGQPKPIAATALDLSAATRDDVEDRPREPAVRYRRRDEEMAAAVAQGLMNRLVVDRDIGGRDRQLNVADVLDDAVVIDRFGVALLDLPQQVVVCWARVADERRGDARDGVRRLVRGVH